MSYDAYEKEKMKELINNPLFRAANEKMCKLYEKELKEDEVEKIVKEYLQEHKTANFMKVVSETDVDINILEGLVSDGRIGLKITDQDYTDMENMKKDLLRDIVSMGKNMQRTDDERKEKEATDKRASGMYSKKK